MSAVVDFTVKEAIVGLVSRGVAPVKAAKMVGLSGKRELDALLRDDQEFAGAMSDAIAVMVGNVDQRCYEEAMDGNTKAMELFYRQHRPEIMAPAGARTGSSGAAQVNIAQMTVQITRDLLMGEHGADFIRALHHPQEVIEATLVDDDDG